MEIIHVHCICRYITGIGIHRAFQKMGIIWLSLFTYFPIRIGFVSDWTGLTMSIGVARHSVSWTHVLLQMLVIYHDITVRYIVWTNNIFCFQLTEILYSYTELTGLASLSNDDPKIEVSICLYNQWHQIFASVIAFFAISSHSLGTFARCNNAANKYITLNIWSLY